MVRLMKKTECTIKKLDENNDITKCIKIIDSVLGKNYINYKQIMSMVKNEKFICLKATVDKLIVGIAIACIMDFNEAIGYLKIEKDEIPDFIKQCNKVSIIKTIAIDDNFQKLGIGSNFIRNLEKIFFNENIHVVFTVAWRHNNIENIGPLMIKNEYKSLYIIEKYYEKDSLKEGFSCPICGDNGCHCDANIYFKLLSSAY